MSSHPSGDWSLCVGSHQPSLSPVLGASGLRGKCTVCYKLISLTRRGELRNHGVSMAAARHRQEMDNRRTSTVEGLVSLARRLSSKEFE